MCEGGPAVSATPGEAASLAAFIDVNGGVDVADRARGAELAEMPSVEIAAPDNDRSPKRSG